VCCCYIPVSVQVMQPGRFSFLPPRNLKGSNLLAKFAPIDYKLLKVIQGAGGEKGQESFTQNSRPSKTWEVRDAPGPE